MHLFGGTIASQCRDATHLIMKKRPRTTIEFFGCVSTAKYIVNENWLKDSHSQLKLQGKFLFLIFTIMTSHQ